MSRLDDSPEPDAKYTLSRRDVLTASGSGIIASFAGCSGDGDDNEEIPLPTTEDRTEHERSFVVEEITSTQTKFTIDFPELPQPSEPDEPLVKFTLRFYTTPLFSDEYTLVTKNRFSQQEVRETHAIDYAPDSFPLDYAQQIYFTIEPYYPEEEDEVFVSRKRNDTLVRKYDKHKKGEAIFNGETVIIPFRNEGRDEITLRIGGPPAPSENDWGGHMGGNKHIDGDTLGLAEVWMREVDDEFNTPDPDAKLYPKDWYGEYQDIKLTAVIRYAVFEHLYDNSVPHYSWLVVSFSMSKWEMIESRRWNSYMLQQYERGTVGPDKDDIFDEDDYTYDYKGSLMQFDNIVGRRVDVEGNVTEEHPRPFEQYYRSRYGKAGQQLEGAGGASLSGLVFAGSRPMSHRWAERLKEAIKNDKNFSQSPIRNEEYYKLYIFHILSGTQMPWFGGLEGYNMEPELVVKRWYERVTEKELNGSPGVCKDFSRFFAGIAMHLIEDYNIGLVKWDRKNTIGHMTPAVFELDLPAIFDRIDHPYGSRLIKNDNSNIYHHVDEGMYYIIETMSVRPPIGYIANIDRDDVYISINSYITKPVELNSHIPLNNELMPDVDGNYIGAKTDNVEDPFEFENTVVNPSSKPWFEFT